ncbi:MAG: DUF2179 domain-containing protein [Calditrichaeota bacterium]|nr:DUF2179 domain-containing protein [Calditrichota bacterium]
MDMSLFLNAAMIFVFRIIDVSLGTIRMIFIIQGRRIVASLIGFVEVTIFLVAISKAIAGMHNVVSVIAYSGGFACGTLLGITIEHKLALGWSHIRVISQRYAREIASALRQAGFGVTVVPGEGMKGPVELVYTTVRRKQTRQVIKMVESIDREAFITLHDSRHIFRGHVAPNLKK